MAFLPVSSSFMALLDSLRVDIGIAGVDISFSSRDRDRGFGHFSFPKNTKIETTLKLGRKSYDFLEDFEVRYSMESIDEMLKIRFAFMNFWEYFQQTFCNSHTHSETNN